MLCVLENPAEVCVLDICVHGAGLKVNSFLLGKPGLEKAEIPTEEALQRYPQNLSVSAALPLVH